MAIAPVLGMGTTYNLPNYHGDLFNITPADTPFLSMIGGLTGGKRSSGQTEHEWQYADLRVGGKRVRLEGADAPTAQERPRASQSNILQIHQEAVTLSYTKLAATQMYAGLAIGGPSNPVVDELRYQLDGVIKSIALDAEYSFLCGTYQKPTDNTTARQTRGIIQAIEVGVNDQDNYINKGGSPITGVAVTITNNRFTKTSHGLSDGDQVVVKGGEDAGFLNTEVYYVVGSASGYFSLALTAGGSAIVPAADVASVTVTETSASDIVDTDVLTLMQTVWQNGGIRESETATILVGASQKRVLTKEFITDANYQEQSRTVGGVAVQTIETDFGRINLMLSRTVPKDAVLLVSAEQCAPVFLEIPEKGFLFVEELARTGASVKKQVYGEIGLEYGNALAHGVLRGCKVSHVAG